MVRSTKKRKAPIDWSKESVPQLKEELGARGLKKGGNKPELLARLRSDDEKKAKEKANKKRKRDEKKADIGKKKKAFEKEDRQKAASKKHRIVLMGNPGAGKSTILNSLIQKVAFKSGVTHGPGLTEVYKEYTIFSKGTSTTFVDTPGLNEFAKKKAVAKEISKAIVPGVATTLVFVCSYGDGRQDPSFVKTCRIIMSSFPVEHPFTVVFNKVAPTYMSESGKAKITDYTSKTFAMFGLSKIRYAFIPLHKEALGEPNMLLADASKYNDKIIGQTRCKTGGLTIMLKRAALQFTSDEDYDDAMQSLKGETLHLRGEFHTWAQDPAGKDIAPECQMSARLRFNNNPKAHCEHCVWWKVMKSRRARESPCTKTNSSPCLLCHCS